MIPNILHFVFGLDEAFGGKPFSFIHFLAIQSAAQVHRPSEIILHYAYLPNGPWWEAARPLVNLNRVAPPQRVFGRELSHVAHKADVLRLEVLQRYGGIYLDCDTFSIRAFEPLRVHDTVLAVEPNAGLCNAVILTTPNSPFIQLWLESYRNYDASRWRYNSVEVPYAIARQCPELIHVEGEYAFFFPTYDDPMHRWLWTDDLGFVERVQGLLRVIRDIPYYMRPDSPVRFLGYMRHTLATRAWYYKQIRKSYCIHLWESLWWEPYLRTFTPDSLLSSPGLFARVVQETLGTSLEALVKDTDRICAE